ncbi:MAG: hypothetical protein N0E44_18040 [Candidatus Thiodiazotropha lotti]|nr:hypothetical protein [Candidatus Thiodiazotropha lotti]MCW4221785.1 hypothetical protein [Candidatus Thiodiazotropha lotti]
MEEMIKERLSDREINYVQVFIGTERGCNPEEGEYSLTMGGFIGALNLDAPGGVDDISLVIDAIKNHVDFSNLPEEGSTEVILKESGEWEDVFWHKYYEIDRLTKYSA